VSKANISLNLGLAEEFLAAANWAHEMGFHNVSHTNSVNSAIRAKDAIAIKLAGKSRRLAAHGKAVDELSSLAGGAELAAAFNRILQDKNRFEYSDELATKARSADQLGRAERFLDRAKALCL
jgi:hypothetical protein